MQVFGVEHTKKASHKQESRHIQTEDILISISNENSPRIFMIEMQIMLMSIFCMCVGLCNNVSVTMLVGYTQNF